MTYLQYCPWELQIDSDLDDELPWHLEQSIEESILVFWCLSCNLLRELYNVSITPTDQVSYTSKCLCILSLNVDASVAS